MLQGKEAGTEALKSGKLEDALNLYTEVSKPHPDLFFAWPSSSVVLTRIHETFLGFGDRSGL